jgi:outer membrane protein
MPTPQTVAQAQRLISRRTYNFASGLKLQGHPMRLTSMPLSGQPAMKALMALMALMIALPSLAWAQDLQSLYNDARGYDATYLAAKSNAASAEFRAAQSDALARPSAALQATAGLARTDPAGSRLAADASYSAGASVNGKYPLFNKGNKVTIERAYKGLTVAQADVDAAEQDLIVRLAQAYFDVLAAQDTLATTRASKAAITEQLASAKRNFEVGTATITDTREAQARFDLASAQEIAADNDLRTKRIALDTLVGRSGVQPKPLLVPVVLPATKPANAEEWVTGADQQHPTVRRAKVGLDVAMLDTEIARAAELPTVDAVGSVGVNNLGKSNFGTNGTSNTATLGVQLNWPLYTGGATQNRIKETLALEDKSRNDLEAARRGVAQGARVAFFGVQSGLAQVKALEAAESSSKLALEATQLGYKVGVRVNLDVLNAQTQLFTTQRDLAKARYDVLMGGLRLRQAAGQLAPADVDAVNRLLAK